MARRELAAHVWLPHYELPRPATRPERIAAEMMTGAHLKAAELGLNLGEILTAVLYFAGEPEVRVMRIADAGDLIAEIAEAMVEAGRVAAQTIPEHMPHSDHANDMRVARHKLEIMPCPCCWRPFGESASG